MLKKKNSTRTENKTTKNMLEDKFNISVKNLQVGGYLGYYGYCNDEKTNKKVINANKLVDEYNGNVSNKPVEEQMKYQSEMLRKIHKIFADE